MAIGGSPEIARAAIGLYPVIQGVQGNIASQLAGSQVMSGADKAGRSIGSRLGSTITSTLKTGLKVGGVITGAIAGLTLKGGINRALGIEDARAKMTGLGYDTQSVEKIMGNALSSVEGTAFGLDAAATTAAGAVAAGIKPGEQLEKTLSTVANTAAAAGTGMDEIGNIFNTVASVGAAYTGDINMIAQRGIPIWQSLGDQLGVSQAEVKKMATEGKIDFATFEAAASDAAGGVATAMGDTTRGSIANMLTSFSKLGADVVTRFLPMVKAGASGIQATVQAVTAKLGPVLDQLFGSFTPSATAGIEGFFENLVVKIDAFDPQVILDFFGRVKGFVSGIDFSSVSGFFGSLSGGAGGALSSIGGSLSQIGDASPTLLASGLELLGSAMSFLAEHSDTLVKLLPIIIAGFVAYKVATQGLTAAVTAQRAADIATLPVQIARNATSFAAAVARNRATMAEIRLTAATNTNTATTARATIAERARTIATNIGAAASKAAAFATRLLGAAIRFATGPIGLIIAGVSLLAAGLVYFFTKTETGQKLWTQIWGWIKNAAAAVVDWFTGTALPYLQAAWDGIAAGALWLYENGIKPAWNGIRTAIGAVGDWITGTLWPAMQAAWSGIAAAALWLWHNVITPVWNGIKLAIAIAVTAVLVYIDLLKWYFSNVIAPVAIWLYEKVLKPAWAGIQTAIGAVVAWVRDTAWPILKAAWDAVAGAAIWLWQSVLKPAWDGIRAAIGAVVTWFRDTAWPMLGRVIDWIATKFDQFKIGLGIIWGFVKNSIINPVVSWFKNTVWPLIDKVLGWIQMSFEGWKIILGAVWDFVKNRIINPVVTWFRDTAWPMLRNVLENIKGGFGLMRDNLKAVWKFIKDRIIAPVANWFQDTILPKITAVTDNIASAFDTMKEGIKSAWDAVKEAARVPVKFVVEDVYNDSLRSTFNGVADKLSLPDKWRLPLGKVGFASGGVMPGYTPGRDVHQFYSPTGGRLDLSGGEAIMRPEWTRAVGGAAAVDDMNRKARRGEAFAGGGIWGRIKGVGGDAWDWITDQASAITEAISDPFGTLTKLAGKVTDLIPGGGMVREMAVGAGKNAGEMLGDWLRSQLAPVMTDGSAAPVATRGGGSLGMAGNLARAHGLQFTSGYRPGARTRRTGSVSYHALGRAHDYAAPMTADGKRRMMAYFNAMHPYKPTELLYSPAGNRQWRRWGAQAQTSGSTYRGHLNHVHVAFKKGGVFGDHAGLAGGKPFLYDKGGEIPPGVRMVANKTRRPEKILPPRESKVITDLGRSGGRRDDGPLNLSDESIERLAGVLASRPNVVQIDTRQAGRLAAAGAGAKRAMGGSW